MGSFSITCSASSLPISAGDEVRCLLLAKSPYDDSQSCYVHSLWWPRTFPLRGVYNDYGSIEQIQDPDLQQLWLDSLKLDMVEKGMGDNTCHDVPVREDMSFDALLEAIWEGRLEVRQTESSVTKKLNEAVEKTIEESGGNWDPTLPEIAEGIPTIARIEKLIMDADCFLGNATNCYLVDDEDGYGQIRVRVGGYGGSWEALKYIEPVIARAGYATMICRNTSDSGNALYVRPATSCERYHGSRFALRAEKVLPVRQVMIREDVWQALLAIPYDDHDPDLRYKIREYAMEDSINGVTATWNKIKEVLESGSRLRPLMDLERCLFGKEVVPFTTGTASMMRMAAERSDDWSEETTKAFLQSAAELHHVEVVLLLTRYQWRPSYTSGPQYGEWGLHEQVTSAFHRIAAEQAAAHSEEG